MKAQHKCIIPLFLLISLLFATACGQPNEPQEGTSTLSSVDTSLLTEATEAQGADVETEAKDIMLLPGKTVMSEDLIPLRNALMDYYLAMFKDTVADGSKDAVISPFSVFAATAMVTEGAKGETLAALETLMGVPQADLDAMFGLYLGDPGCGSALLTANSIWVDTHQGMTINQDTFDHLRMTYGAGVFHQDLQAAETVGQVNQWISDHTKGRIPEMLDKISEDSRLMLINALSFDGEWSDPYTEYQQKDGLFKNADGTSSTVTMMSNTEGYYIEDENASGFYKLYKPSEDGKRYAFAAILPKEGMTPSEYLATLDGDGLRQILFHYTDDVILYTKLPAFKAEAAYELSETYQRMGCTIPFTGAADFTGLAVSGNPIYIGSITHKAMIEVDALGTKAGAATIIDMPESAGPMEPSTIREVYLDRPFIYMILDCETGLPVFMGVMASGT